MCLDIVLHVTRLWPPCLIFLILAITGITRELEAVSVAGSWWPDKLADIEDNARKAPTGYEYELVSE
jgi:hypothetical protein